MSNTARTQDMDNLNNKAKNHIPTTLIMPTSAYIPCLNGLRGISILLVIFSHFGFGNIIPGGLGVTIFFFISGFLITRLLLAELNASNQISLKNFYLRRSFRIFPALFFLILVCISVAAFMHCRISWGEILSAVFFYKNYYEIAMISDSLHRVLPLGILWSLCVEEHFYIFYPFLFVCFVKDLKKLLLFLFALIVFANIWRFITVNYLSYSYQYNYYATDTRIDSILYGCLLSVLCQLPSGTQLIKRLSSSWLLYVSVFLFVFSLLYRNEEFKYTLRFTLQGLSLIPIFSILLFSNEHQAIKLFLESRLMKWIGKLSYSLYLWHFCALKVIQYPGFQVQKSLVYPLAFILSFVLAAISYYFVESKFLLLSRSLFSRYSVKAEIQQNRNSSLLPSLIP